MYNLKPVQYRLVQTKQSSVVVVVVVVIPSHPAAMHLLRPLPGNLSSPAREFYDVLYTLRGCRRFVCGYSPICLPVWTKNEDRFWSDLQFCHSKLMAVGFSFGEDCPFRSYRSSNICGLNFMIHYSIVSAFFAVEVSEDATSGDRSSSMLLFENSAFCVCSQRGVKLA